MEKYTLIRLPHYQNDFSGVIAHFNIKKTKFGLIKFFLTYLLFINIDCSTLIIHSEFIK